MNGEEVTGILSIETDGHRVVEGKEAFDKFRAVLWTKEDNLRITVALPVEEEEERKLSGIISFLPFFFFHC